MVSSPDTSRQAGAQRVAKHALARRKSGLARAAVWIPEAAREKLAAYARKLRAEAGMLLPADPVPAKPATTAPPPPQPNKPKQKPRRANRARRLQRKKAKQRNQGARKS